ncbi:hypothetical protein AMAG_04870 [Allomyces macrogynus ATCC 38327]|uniref:Cyclin N-terminal domain-containing protein n=1 Tax=Allomyces macrogynus (strain ATCC 38327) TaxID=578462 RepID=A0A0L0S6U4_ALLM3|nr:hypothetical protein AMAG_04870 [Allomyces macrogynus ATCC 38327]|eukprot:KNE58044.1 hypothetical protein AMAG_04870 [Allomyces macrogynus ATCC 38327]
MYIISDEQWAHESQGRMLQMRVNLIDLSNEMICNFFQVPLSAPVPAVPTRSTSPREPTTAPATDPACSPTTATSPAAAPDSSVAAVLTSATSPAGSPRASEPPATPTFNEFIYNVVQRTRTPLNAIALGLMYVTRLHHHNPGLTGGAMTPHRVMLAGLMLACKMLYDDTYSNRTWVHVSQAHFGLAEINAMEWEFARYLDYRFLVTQDAWVHFLAEVDNRLFGLANGDEGTAAVASSAPGTTAASPAVAGAAGSHASSPAPARPSTTISTAIANRFIMPDTALPSAMARPMVPVMAPARGSERMAASIAARYGRPVPSAARTSRAQPARTTASSAAARPNVYRAPAALTFAPPAASHGDYAAESGRDQAAASAYHYQRVPTLATTAETAPAPAPNTAIYIPPPSAPAAVASQPGASRSARRTSWPVEPAPAVAPVPPGYQAMLPPGYTRAAPPPPPPVYAYAAYTAPYRAPPARTDAGTADPYGYWHGYAANYARYPTATAKASSDIPPYAGTSSSRTVRAASTVPAPAQDAPVESATDHVVRPPPPPQQQQQHPQQGNSIRAILNTGGAPLRTGATGARFALPNAPPFMRGDSGADVSLDAAAAAADHKPDQAGAGTSGMSRMRQLLNAGPAAQAAPRGAGPSA